MVGITISFAMLMSGRYHVILDRQDRFIKYSGDFRSCRLLDSVTADSFISELRQFFA